MQYRTPPRQAPAAARQVAAQPQAVRAARSRRRSACAPGAPDSDGAAAAPAANVAERRRAAGVGAPAGSDDGRRRQGQTLDRGQRPGRARTTGRTTADADDGPDEPTARMAPDRRGPVKLAVVVQRYGADISGGAELHARYIAERLARHADGRGADDVRARLRHVEERASAGRRDDQRYPRPAVSRSTRPRNPDEFGRLSSVVFDRPHSIADELRWLDSEGPTSPALIRHIQPRPSAFDFFVFFSYRYYHAWHGARAVPAKAILVPTAERDPAIGLGDLPAGLPRRRARSCTTRSRSARSSSTSAGERAPASSSASGSEIPERTQPWRFRKKFNVRRPFALYIGRIDENKGCPELFSHFERYAVMYPHGLDLVLVGSSVLPIPKHPRIRHLGFLSDEDKFDALAAADLLIMPSQFESLSMVALEAWALGKPVLANGHCDVLRGQVIRSNAGLYYESFEEFAEALYLLEATGPLGGIARPQRARVLPAPLHAGR